MSGSGGRFAAVLKRVNCHRWRLLSLSDDSLHGNTFNILFRQFGAIDNRFYNKLDRCSANFPFNALNINGSGHQPEGNFVLSRSEFSSQVKMPIAPKVKLNNGMEMPVFGLGTYSSKENEGEIAIKHAIDCGYRHIDTAFFYQNEEEVGRAVNAKISEGVIKRQDMFIVTKLWCIHHAPDKVEYACRKSLEKLNLDYIDLYLMHIPVGYAYLDDNTLMPKDESGKLMLTDVDYVDTWKAMEKLVKLGLVRSIGVSNFNSEQIERILQNCEIKPVTNQVECHPGLNQKKLTAFCKARDITLTGYCPLGRPNPEEKTPNYLYDDKVKAIADKYKKTPSQVGLRYLIDIGTIPIPKSVTKARIEQNIDIFDFKLSDDDIKILDTFNTGERLVPFLLIKGQNHKYFPFKIEF